jgi:hypothetical protein
MNAMELPALTKVAVKPICAGECASVCQTRALVAMESAVVAGGRLTSLHQEGDAPGMVLTFAVSKLKVDAARLAASAPGPERESGRVV